MIWHEVEERFEVHEAFRSEIEKSQHLKERKNNYFFALIKGAEIGININDVNVSEPLSDGIAVKYCRKLRALRLGENYCVKPKGVIRAIQNLKIRRAVAKISKMILNVISRFMKMCLPFSKW